LSGSEEHQEPRVSSETQERSETTSTFEDLEVWQAARALRSQFAELAKSLSSDERYRLVDQIIRASRSVTANIAEGYERFHYQENIQSCRQARGSLFELVDHLTMLLDEAALSREEFEALRAEIFRVVRM